MAGGQTTPRGGAGSANGPENGGITPPTPPADAVDSPEFAGLSWRFHAASGVLTLRGALDADTAPALTAAIGPEDDVRMIDALELRLLAGAGVNVLLELVGRRPTPVRASPVVRRIIDCCGLGRVLLVSPETG